LLGYNNTPEASYLFEVAEGSLFRYQKKTYQKGRKRRTRFECIELSSKRLYLFNQNAQITLIQ
ncbi:MAG: sprT domain-containing protein, partial [Lutibacter sp.]|nr:sprT domain-containing protein [Lutibacter sp.]